MTKRMLIDSSHSEETRVVILDGNKLDDFEVETSTRKQIKGNIYLAKVIRVEPSLQAAFLDYGGNRHGFLPFNEIHPDYYQIPVADKEALIKSEVQPEISESISETDNLPDDGATNVNNGDDLQKNSGNEDEQVVTSESKEVVAEARVETRNNNNDKKKKEKKSSDDSDELDADVVTVTDDYEDLLDIDSGKPNNHALIKKYKIQEVIKRNQIMLVEVTKEERGNKGVALTTYLSLPGRYCVLMPNSGRDGGVSRKITSSTDRKRLKSIIRELPTTDDMAIIVRTAGKDRNKSEITRDYDYLIKMWNSIREETLKSKAPTLIYEEGNIIKRAIRDIYSKDIDEILVEGDNGYRVAKDFMKTITPSHARKVKQYKETDISLFQRYQIESQLENLHSPVVQLDCGGYLVINQTEALVAVDVNSGRATKERNIEDTALKTNLDASDEIARQLRLRNLAGLVVIDFIDMDEMANNHAIERRMKEVLKRDRARIQIGRISGFGLMEISRQRIHSSFLETSYTVCPHCNGKGLIRSIESASIFMIRIIEEEALRRRASKIIMNVPNDVALYILNYKRKNINAIEERYNIEIILNGDASLIFATDYRMDLEKLVQEKSKEKYSHQNQDRSQSQFKPQSQENNKHSHNKQKENNKEETKEVKEEEVSQANNSNNQKNKNRKNNRKKNFNKNKKPRNPEGQVDAVKTEVGLEKQVSVKAEGDVVKEDVSSSKNKDNNNVERNPQNESNNADNKKKAKRGGLRNLRKRHKFKDKKDNNDIKEKTSADSDASVVSFSHNQKNNVEKNYHHNDTPAVAAHSIAIESAGSNNNDDLEPKKGWWQKLMS
ncbi:MAG: ribonuclease E/G [Alphaproteobacteria bacterium]